MWIAKRTVFIKPLALLLLIGSALQGFADESAELLDKQTRAYITVVYADDAIEKGQAEEAKKKYAEALKIYREIQKTDPAWNREVIDFRIANCINALEKIQRNQQSSSSLSSTQKDQTTKYYETRYQSAVKENDYLRSKISKLELELESADDATDLRAQIAELRRENIQLKNGQETVEDAFAADLRKARENASALRDQLDRQKQEMANLQLIRDRHDRVLEQLQVNQAQRASLQKQVDELTRRLESETAAVDQLEAKLEKSRVEEASPEIIQMLEKQLNNEKSINRQLVSQLGTVDGEKGELETTVEDLEKQNTEFARQISTLLGREKETAEALSALRQQQIELTQKNQALESALSDADKNPSADLQTEEALSKATRQLTEASRQRDLNSETVRSQQNEIRALTARNATIQQELEKMKEETTLSGNTQLAQLKEKVEALETERVGLKQALQNAAEDLRAWKAESKSPSDPASENMVPKAKYDALQAEMIDLRYEVTKLQNAVAKSSESPALELAYEEKVEDLEALKAEHAQLQKQFASLRIEQSISSPSPSTEVKRADLDEANVVVPELPLTPKNEQESIPAAADALSRGIDAEQRGDLDTARMAYEEVLAEAPENMPALKGKIRILLQQQNPREALPFLDQAEDIDVKDLEVHLLEGMTWYQLENYRRAGSILRKLLRKEPGNARAHNVLGAVYMAEKDYFRSRDSFNNAVIHDPSLSDAHFNLAQVVRLSDPNNRVLIREHYEIALSLGATRDPSMEAFLNE